MERSAPDSRAGTPVPRAPAGSDASRSASVLPVGKFTSPPKAKVTGWPSPSQSGSIGELLADTARTGWPDRGGRCTGPAARCDPPADNHQPTRATRVRPSAHTTRFLRTLREVATGRDGSGGNRAGSNSAGTAGPGAQVQRHQEIGAGVTDGQVVHRHCGSIENPADPRSLPVRWTPCPPSAAPVPAHRWIPRNRHRRRRRRRRRRPPASSRVRSGSGSCPRRAG